MISFYCNIVFHIVVCYNFLSKLSNHKPNAHIVMIEKTRLTKQFAHRLRDTLIAKNYCSSRSTSGVDIYRFAKMAGHSPQICRKYLRGEAVPELSKLVEIASKLNVSPGWLLFGDSHTNHPEEENKITISKNLLHYIFTHANMLYQSERSHQDKLPNFLLELTKDVSQIEVNDEQSKKIIDLAMSLNQPSISEDKN